MEIFRAEYISRHYYFTAYGLSKKEAVDTLYMGLNEHRDKYELENDWYDDEDIDVQSFNLGSAYRDGNEIYKGDE